MEPQSKKCPMCAEQIPLTAVTCEYCGAQFTVTINGYCQNCHQVRNADENGQCKVCGNAVMDLRVESKLIEEPAQKPLPVSQAISQTEITKARKSRLPFGILAGILVFAVIGVFLWLGRNSLPAVPSLFATSTPTVTATSTPTSTPTVSPTRTPRPTPTVTPLPSWVTEFAEPILAAMANNPPHFQDDFSQESVSWRFHNTHKDHGKMEIKDGALITTIEQGGLATGMRFCGAHPGMRFKNFVLRVDIDISKLGSRDAAEIGWRGTDNSDGLAFTLWQDGGWEAYSFEAPEHKLASGWQSINSTEKVIVTIISKDTEYAIYIDNTLVASINDSGRRPGVGIRLCTWDELGLPTVIKYDNLKVWDPDKIQIQP